MKEKTDLVTRVLKCGLTCKERNTGSRVLKDISQCGSETSKNLKMLKKLLAFLSLFAFLSLLFYSVVLYYSQNVHFNISAFPRTVVKGNQTFSGTSQDNLQVFEPSQKTTRMPSNRTLELCPETPPKLEGPLYVEFNSKRTLEEMKKEVGSSLQVGGRYKPPDCISRQKVGKNL